MTLEQLRERIDRLDQRLLELLNRPARLAIQVGRLKRQQGKRLFDPKRERAILLRMTRTNGGPLSSEAVRAIYRDILTQIRRLEHRNFASRNF